MLASIAIVLFIFFWLCVLAKLTTWGYRTYPGTRSLILSGKEVSR